VWGVSAQPEGVRHECYRCFAGCGCGLSCHPSASNAENTRRAWIDAALAEKDFLDFEEPYRLQR